MTALHLAQINVGTTVEPLDHPALAGFVALLDEVNALAEASPGFVWRLKGEGNDATDLKVTDDPRFIVNMSVWTGVEALFDFVYKSAHRLPMAHRRQWFQRPMGAYQALWWVPAGHRPTVEEGMDRLRRIDADGPTSLAFTFKRVFAPLAAGAPVDLRPEPFCVGWR